MLVKVLNCPDRDFKPYVVRAVQFYGQYLIPSNRLRRNINVTVKFDKKLDVWAFASIEHYNASHRPRDFLIEIHPWIGAPDILKTLAHEMVHIKQFVMCETNETLSKWKGRPIDTESLDYYMQPWEMEAYSIETGLWVKFAVKEKLWNVFKGVNNPDEPIKKQLIKWKNENRTPADW